MFVRTEDMMSVIGTQHVADLDVVHMDSVWISGFDLMKGTKHPFQQRQMMRSNLTVKRYQH